MRLLLIGLLAFATVSGAEKAASADDLQLVSGQLSYLHGVVDPASAVLCDGPIPGLLFTGVEGPVTVSAPGFSAAGTGVAETCAYFAPVFGIYAQYSGTVTLQTSAGETLLGSFFGIDINPFVFSETGQPVVFETVAVMRLTTEDGEFVGLLTATGIDNPFGIDLGPFFPCATEENPAGVCATFDGVIVGDDD